MKFGNDIGDGIGGATVDGGIGSFVSNGICDLQTSASASDPVSRLSIDRRGE